MPRLRSRPALWLGRSVGLVLLGALAALAWRAWGPRRFSPRHPPDELYLRVFKEEGELEMWGRRGEEPFRLLEVLPVTGRSGGPGPKRREGDLQVPEGFYVVDRFNPHSRFHLSLGLDYPNAADRVRSNRVHPGSDIFIHGGHLSVGCVPLGDAGVERVYRLAEATAPRGRAIQVHIFPARMEGAAWEALQAAHPAQAGFWGELRPMYLAFQQAHQVAPWVVEASGRYVVKEPGERGGKTALF